MTQTTKTFAATGHQTGHAQLPQLHLPRNEGVALDLDWVARATANRSAIERRAATIGTRRSVKKAYQTAWLARAVTMIDLTTLSGDDTKARVARLCEKAKQPVRADVLERLGLPQITVGAVCVYHDMVEPALKALEGSGIPVAAVSTGFPAGLSPFHLRVAEIKESVAAGAQEIDIVISRRHILEGSPPVDHGHDEGVHPGRHGLVSEGIKCRDRLIGGEQPVRQLVGGRRRRNGLAIPGGGKGHNLLATAVAAVG